MNDSSLIWIDTAIHYLNNDVDFSSEKFNYFDFESKISYPLFSFSAVFIAYCLMSDAIECPKNFYFALAYIDDKRKIDQPAYGCVAVKLDDEDRICFVVGRDDETKKLQCIEYNHENKVILCLYAEADFYGFYWYGRAANPAPHRYDLSMFVLPAFLNLEDGAIDDDNDHLNEELPWIAEARKHIGLSETAGVKHNPTIVGWVKDLGGWWSDDETAWCGVFIAHCLKSAGIKYPQHWYRALAYADETLAAKLNQPAYGCIAVKKRKGGGHVCFVVGRDEKTGKLLCLGGNQGNAVNIRLYNETNFDGFYWYGRTAKPAPHRYELNLIAGNFKPAGNEA